MESLVHGSFASATSLSPKRFEFLHKGRTFVNGFPFSRPFPTPKLSLGVREGKSLITASAEKKRKKKKVDSHSFVPKPDEATGPFPEAVLLKERKVQEDGRRLPDFADAEEEELFEFLNLQLESDLNVDIMRHYEVVYLIHEDRVDEVGSVISKVEDFVKEKNGKIWRLNNWGLRRLAYKIKKAKNANYILMNIELGAKWINDFKSMLDKDERIIRHLVIKRDEAITKDCPPPPEFHTLRANVVEEDDDMDEFDAIDDDGEDRDDANELDLVKYNDDIDTENGIFYVDDDDDDGQDNRDGKSDGVRKEARTLKAEKIAR